MSFLGHEDGSTSEGSLARHHGNDAEGMKDEGGEKEESRNLTILLKYMKGFN